MTTTQLTAMGIPLGQWISMSPFCDIVSLQDDNNLYVDDFAMQFYFDTAGLMFIRYTDSRTAVPYDSSKTMPSDYVTVSNNGKQYFVRLSKNGVKDSTAGIYHDVITISNIIGILINK